MNRYTFMDRPYFPKIHTDIKRIALFLFTLRSTAHRCVVEARCDSNFPLCALTQSNYQSAKNLKSKFPFRRSSFTTNQPSNRSELNRTNQQANNRNLCEKEGERNGEKRSDGTHLTAALRCCCTDLHQINASVCCSAAARSLCCYSVCCADQGFYIL